MLYEESTNENPKALSDSPWRSGKSYHFGILNEQRRKVLILHVSEGTKV